MTKEGNGFYFASDAEEAWSFEEADLDTQLDAAEAAKQKRDGAISDPEGLITMPPEELAAQALIVPKPIEGYGSGLFADLMAFQYGEEEESDAAWHRLTGGEEDTTLSGDEPPQP